MGANKHMERGWFGPRTFGATVHDCAFLYKFTRCAWPRRLPTWLDEKQMQVAIPSDTHLLVCLAVQCSELICLILFMFSLA